MITEPRTALCPLCGTAPEKNLHAYSLTLVSMDGVMMEEIKCGKCQGLVGIVEAPTGLVPASKWAREAWNAACEKARV